MPVRRVRRPPWPQLVRVLTMQPVWAVPFAAFFGTIFGGQWPQYVLAYKASLVFAFAIGLALWAVEQFVEPRLVCATPQGRRPTLRIGATYLIAATLASCLAAVLDHLFVVPGFLGSPRAVVISAGYTLLFVALFGGINFAIAFYRITVDQAETLAAQRVALAQAELRALRAQLNPHFLFNTLNTIASLIAERPADAEETTTRLAELFRYALRASDHEHQRFDDELAFLRDYLAIERMRFGRRLTLREDIAPGLGDVPVPSLLLQPLVENAVRHGVATRVEGGTVTLAARRAGTTLEIDVADDGPGFAAEAGVPDVDGHFGLRSVRERLRLAGPPHALEIRSTPSEGTRVRVVLPLPPTADTPGGHS